MNKVNNLRLPPSFILIFFLFVTISPPGMLAQEKESLTLTLTDAIGMALEKNWDIKIANQDVLKAEEQINEAYANAFPRIDLTGRYIRYIELPVLFIPPNTAFNPTPSTLTFKLGSDNSYDATVSLSQVIYSQKVNTAIKIADDYSQYAQQGSKATLNETVLSVKRAFYNVLLMKELVKVTKQSYESAAASYNNISALYKQGVASEYDQLRAEVQVANVQPAMIQTENNLELSLNYLKSLLAIDLKKPLEVKGEFEYMRTDSILMEETSELAVDNNPFLRQLELQEALLDKSYIIEKSEYFPTLAFFGQYSYQTQDNTFKFSDYNWAKSMMVGLQLSYTLFDGFRRGARMEQALIDKGKVALTRKKLEEGVRIQVLQARLKMKEAEKKIYAQEKNLKQAEKTVSIAQTRFKNGIGTQLELIDTQTALTFAMTNHAQAIYEYLIAKSEWEYAVSLPVKNN